MQGYDTEDKSNSVKSVIKAFLIMEALDKYGELSIGELSDRLHMDKSTVHRLINTIKDAGYINQNPDSRKYANSLKLLAMGNRVMDKTGVKHIARPVMEELASKTGETINLGVMAGNKIFYIDKLESSSTIKVGLGIGTSVPCYCSGLGKVILAYMPEKERQNVLGSISFEIFTENTITDIVLLQEELKKVRNVGYAIDDEEYLIGLICFGAPIFDYHGDPIAAISVSCPKYRYDPDQHLTLYAELVAEAAERISRMLGFKPNI
ncbi:MAG: kdgR 2 [Bacillota bacterium]|jgi:DNA-binding IclR family transcriptional regulator|nr:kdgR 2 [Bacillota bacterium]